MLAPPPGKFTNYSKFKLHKSDIDRSNRALRPTQQIATMSTTGTGSATAAAASATAATTAADQGASSPAGSQGASSVKTVEVEGADGSTTTGGGATTTAGDDTASGAGGGAGAGAGATAAAAATSEDLEEEYDIVTPLPASPSKGLGVGPSRRRHRRPLSLDLSRSLGLERVTWLKSINPADIKALGSKPVAQGSFGEIYKAMWHGEEVAVKRLKVGPQLEKARLELRMVTAGAKRGATLP